jgi:hypothetical protein
MIAFVRSLYRIERGCGRPGEGMKSSIVRPHLWPRDLVDVTIGLAHGLLFGAVLPIGLIALFALLAARAGVNPAACQLGAFAAYVAFGACYLCWTVWHLRLEEAGVRFVRVFGAPKLLRWQDIEEIAPASRSEVVRRGWFSWPLREPSLSMTAKGHYRFWYQYGVQYFPPANASEFEVEVKRWQAIQQQPGEAVP